MSTSRVFESLFNWFDTNPFQVNRMSSSRLEKLAELAGVQLTSFHGTKSKIGKWLSARGGTEYALGQGQRVKLVVLRPGTGKSAAIYQMKLIGSR
jgi:hypothetical protein